MLHVLNGDATRIPLERSGVPGDLTVWADVLHDGPTPAGLSPEHWREVRARHLASRLGVPDAEVLDSYRQADAALDRFRDHDEVVFWFEHDLFDQLILVRHLHWLSQQETGATRFSLICIGSFPGVEPFHGLGQLRPEQLASLLGARQAIAPEQVATGSRVWCAYCESDPADLLVVMEDGASALPFLEGAMHRQFEDYPWLGDGLSRSERQILVALERGARTPHEVFSATQRMEERIFMGDRTFWSVVQSLAAARHPLIALDVTPRPGRLPDGTLALTDTGRDVLAGRADHVALNGVDRWMGGVHLTDGRHRWDPQKRCLALS